MHPEVVKGRGGAAPATAGDSAHRLETDALGSITLPARVYYGIHTARAVANFPISGVLLRDHPAFIVALAMVKQAAAQANQQLGLLDGRRASAIVEACDDVRAGRLDTSFVVDMIQGGAGTSTNMNINEVIANRALEILGLPRGTYEHLHPLSHVNLSQSTNDCYPTAIKVALQLQLSDLIRTLESAASAFRTKATEFAHLVKMGRTQLQDAVPMTLGQEFGAYAVMVGEDAQRLREAATLITEVNLGGTAIGTGLNAPAGYPELVCRRLSEISGLKLSVAVDLVEATQDVGAFVQISGVLKRTAVKLSKICSDLRLLSSGPRAGLNEINLPAVQAGSSIMPGKVNPVIPEVVNQVAFQVIGNDVTVTMAAEAGQLQLNAFEPIIADTLFRSIRHLDAACRVLVSRCIEGITANPVHLRDSVMNSIGVVTALTPVIGYAAAAQIAQVAMASGRPVAELATELGGLPADEVARLLRPEAFVMHAAHNSEEGRP
ncbi:aspartate ammonia-lyase [Mycolicibacterium murale]|uniref:Aspartate ammonia-lyase n=1 Tax=Mycolicibacterium murale TaxID=182220 RepID=A0A7I9WMJ9_9MYCO|nr:aspartate ammonia-lyase [Mycolicibacterium murale]GFG58873.1 aspartate ammonia-lyase [Mycolicibacterium murale]